MKKVLILKGLPGSGKSTHAKKLVDKGGWIRVNKDDLRAMLHNGKHTSSNEKLVVSLRDSIIQEAMKRGLNVVVDDTNLNPVHEENIRKLVDRYMSKPFTTTLHINEEYEAEVKFIDTALKECIRRDLQRQNSVGEKVIMRMYREFLSPKLAKVEPVKDAPKAIICDIDGTLAHIKEGGRSPYDYGRVHEDICDQTIRSVVKRYHDDGYIILLVSGRESDCRDVTEAWLKQEDVPYDFLHMRKAGDNRHDGIVKQEIFDAEIRGKFDVEFVLDDRNRVVEMWRSGGLKVLQVADGDF